MSVGHFVGGAALGACLVGLGAFVVTEPDSVRSAFPYCFQFEPTQDITVIELADIIKIWGGGSGLGSIKAWGKTPDAYGGSGFIDRQFKRCDR